MWVEGAIPATMTRLFFRRPPYPALATVVASMAPYLSPRRSRDEAILYAQWRCASSTGNGIFCPEGVNAVTNEPPRARPDNLATVVLTAFGDDLILGAVI